jgi:hypothetical protein
VVGDPFTAWTAAPSLSHRLPNNQPEDGPCVPSNLSSEEWLVSLRNVNQVWNGEGANVGRDGVSSKA